MDRQIKADLSLFLVTIGWGASFLLTKNSLDSLETYNFLAIRFFIAFVLSSLVFYKKMMNIDKNTMKNGLMLGVLLFTTYAFQTVGLGYTTVSKSAFITGLNVVLVPVLAALILKKTPEKKIIFSTILAFVGLGLLTLNKNIEGINIGDIYTLISAVAIALYVIMVGKFTVKSESVSLAIIQFGVVLVLSLLFTFTTETPTININSTTWITIVFLSVVCTSGAFIIQSVAQKFTSPSHTALIYTCEPVFAAIFGYIFLRELLNIKGMIGAGLIVFSMLLMEINLKGLLHKEKSV